MPGYTCAYGSIYNPDNEHLVDQVVLTVFRAPHSFTGEDMVEISCHGGIAVKQLILDSLFKLGISPAEPGEFTRRAFMNGKLDLMQAEAIMDLIQAGAQKASRVAAVQLQGVLSKKIRQLADQLYQVQAELELILEFPEHEDSEPSIKGLARHISQLKNDLNQLSDSFRQGRMLREGMTVVIAGKPNAGKSSLLNALAGYDRAIVTAVPGTTRDTVEEMVDVEGLPVNLIDTAGLRQTEDEVEKQGVDRAVAALKGADLVFWLISPPAADINADITAVREAECQNLILIAGKDDLAEGDKIREILNQELPELPVLTFSAVSKEGLGAVRAAIVEKYNQAGSHMSEDVLVTNSRHHVCLLRSADLLTQAERALHTGITLDLVATLLRSAAETLADLTGDSVSEKLVDTIFSRFCVGK